MRRGWKDRRQEMRRPRVLPGSGLGRRGGHSLPAATPRVHAWPVAAAACRPALLQALLPAQPPAEPDQQEVWRAHGRETGSVVSSGRDTGNVAPALPPALGGSRGAAGSGCHSCRKGNPLGVCALCRRPFKSVHMKSKRGIRGWKDKVLSACGYLESLLS